LTAKWKCTLASDWLAARKNRSILGSRKYEAWLAEVVERVVGGFVLPKIPKVSDDGRLYLTNAS